MAFGCMGQATVKQISDNCDADIAPQAISSPRSNLARVRVDQKNTLASSLLGRQRDMGNTRANLLTQFYIGVHDRASEGCFRKSTEELSRVARATTTSTDSFVSYPGFKTYLGVIPDSERIAPAS